MLKVFFVASECTPIAKVGGLGDVIGSLPKALAKLGVDPVRDPRLRGSRPRRLVSNGVDVKIVLPFYAVINRKVWQPKFVLDLDSETSVWKTRLPKSKVEVLLIYNKKYLSTGPVYFGRTAFVSSVTEVERFKFFSEAVYQLLARTNAENTRDNAENSAKSASSQRNSAMSGWRPDIVHCNDWHAGFLAKLLKSKSQIPNPKSQTPKIVFTIHNLANQGVWRPSTGSGQAVNFMVEGIKNADMVTTVSPTYAKEILTKKYGAGLESLLKKRAKDGKLIGILNGVDYDFWLRPLKPLRRRAYFQKLLGLKQNLRLPLFSLVSRLTYQKGIDLAVPLVGEFVKKYGAQFLFLGQGELKYEEALKELARKYPKNVFVRIGFDEKLAHKIYRECDFFLMPSRFEPSGLGQMISMHYGTVPIVRATGGLKDTVQHLKTGFVFKNESAADLRKAMELAVKYFYDKKKFNAIRRNCLKQDFSWKKSAKKYKKIYLRQLNKKLSYPPVM